MRAEITGIEKRTSKYGGFFYYVFFRGDGKSFRSCLDPKCQNFGRWEKLLKVGNVIEGLELKGPGLVDADSKPMLIDGGQNDTKM